MAKIAVVYWTGSGNTEEMAKAITEGAIAAGADAKMFSVDSFPVSGMGEYEAFIFGCPAMGDEVLEEGEFEPFFAEAEGKLIGVPVALFGSYGWGSGAWMEDWAERTKKAGAKLFSSGLIIANAPDDDGINECKSLGESFAKSL